MKNKMKNFNNIEFELTPFLKESKIYIQIFTNAKGDIKKVLEYIINSKNDRFSFEDFKVFKIKKQRLKDIFSELDMLGIAEPKFHEITSSQIKQEIKAIKRSRKKYSNELTEKGRKNYKRGIEKREKLLEKLKQDKIRNKNGRHL